MSALLESLAAGAPELSPARRSVLEHALARGLPTQRIESVQERVEQRAHAAPCACGAMRSLTQA